MAAVSVDQGMPGPEESAHKVDRSRWQLLAMARRRWAEIDLPFDCRLLRTVVDEAPMLAEGLGMESGNRFLTDYLSLDLDLVGRVLGWLEREQPTEAVPLALAASQAQPLAAHGEIGNGRADESRGSNATSTKQDRGQAYLLRRLARDAPEVLERVKSGEIKSARAAAIEAGIIKPVPTVRLVPDPTRAAASIVERMDRAWCVALATAIAEQIRDVASRSPPPAP
jgi:hypothetical protein